MSRVASPAELDYQFPMRIPVFPLVFAALAGVAVGGSCGQAEERPALCGETSGRAIFEQRIQPVLQDDRPTSCNECHLSGVDLGLFARETPCETLACMRDLGLVDLRSPDRSLVLDWIDRASPSSPLITQEVIDEEYRGMREWIEYYADCGLSECSEVQCGEGKEPFCELEDWPLGERGRRSDPGGCSDVALEQLFREAVYVARRRCYPCHSQDDEINFPRAGHWLVEEGTCEVASLRTMHGLIERGLVNPTNPAQSLLLLKPLEETEGGIQHEGLDKFHPGDPNYEDMLYWLTRYGECQVARSEF